MRPRVFAAFALATGLVLLLALAVAAQRAELEDANETIPEVVSAGPAGSLTTLREAPSSDDVPEIAFTPAFTTYLSAVFRGHPYCSTIPTLTGPADGSNLDTLIPLFTWYSGIDPNATALYLDIWRDAQLTDRVAGLSSSDRTQGAHQWRIDLNLDPATTYYWRAHLMCDSTEGPYSEVWSFATGSGGTILPGPDLLSPENGSASLGNVLVTLRWSPVSGAVEYRVNWTSGGWLHTIVVTGTETKLGPGPGTYEWWVQARNDYAWGTESAHWRFHRGGHVRMVGSGSQ
jgi:hypothetical protein